MNQKRYIHLHENYLYNRVKFLVNKFSYNTHSIIFLIVFNLLIIILSIFCCWIQALISLLLIKLSVQICCLQHLLLDFAVLYIWSCSLFLRNDCCSEITKLLQSSSCESVCYFRITRLLKKAAVKMYVILKQQDFWMKKLQKYMLFQNNETFE